ncbi:MAG: hypothetical protein ABSH56_23840 [Bryobacteraceae bacterium]|jgi:hypothetical protein
MQHNLVAVPACLLREAAQLGEHELLKISGAANQSSLATQVVSEEEAVHQAARSFEKTLFGLVVKFADLVGHEVHRFRVRMHFDEILFHAE